MAIEKGYLQSDEFAKKEYDSKVDFLSEHSPTFSKMEPAAQREFIFKRTKQPEYKTRDTLSKVARFAVPLAGQYGGEALAGGAALPSGPGALAAAMAGGGAGATLGEAGVDVMDYMRGMGPRPSLKGELKKAPMRMGYGAVGSGLGKGLVKFVNPKTAEGALETLGNPRLYTRAIPQIEKGMGTEAKVSEASRSGEESIAKYQADAENKVVDTKSAMKQHWNKQGYGDPVASEFEPKGPEPIPPKPIPHTHPGYAEYVKKQRQWMSDHAEWEKTSGTPKKVSLDLNSLYKRYTDLLEKRGKGIPAEKEVPELVNLKRNIQDKIYQGKADPASRLPDQDWRRVGKITNSIDERLGKLDPKLKELEIKYSQAMDEMQGTSKNPIVRKMKGATGPEFTDRYAKMAKKRAQRGETPPGEKDIGAMRDIEEKSGIPFTDKLTTNLSAEHFKRVLAEGSSMWQKRMGIAAPLVLGGAAASGKMPPSYLAAMSLLAAMLSPAVAKQMVTNVPKYGMQALSQGLRQEKEPEPQ